MGGQEDENRTPKTAEIEPGGGKAPQQKLKMPNLDTGLNSYTDPEARCLTS